MLVSLKILPRVLENQVIKILISPGHADSKTMWVKVESLSPEPCEDYNAGTGI